MWILAILFLIVLFLLVVPIYFSISVSLPEGKDIRIRLWGSLFGVWIRQNEIALSLLGLQWKLKKTKSKPQKKQKTKKAKAAKKPKTEAKSPKPKESSDLRKNAKRMWCFLESTKVRRAWIQALSRFLARALHVIRFRSLKADLCIGLDAPHQTGLMMGCWYAVLHANIPLPKAASLHLSPNFAKTQVSGDTEIKGHTSIGLALLPVLVLVWHAPLYRTYRIIRS